MLNRVTIAGRIVHDIELRSTPNGVPVTSFRIACQRNIKTESGEREADFIDIVTWRSAAEFVSRNFNKGDEIIIDGHLQSRNWTDRDGNKRTSTEIEAENIYFCGSKRKAEKTFYEVEEDEDVPF